MALILQNSEFLQELRHDESFMKTLENGTHSACFICLSNYANLHVVLCNAFMLLFFHSYVEFLWAFFADGQFLVDDNSSAQEMCLPTLTGQLGQKTSGDELLEDMSFCLDPDQQGSIFLCCVAFVFVELFADVFVQSTSLSVLLTMKKFVLNFPVFIG